MHISSFMLYPGFHLFPQVQHYMPLSHICSVMTSPTNINLVTEQSQSISWKNSPQWAYFLFPLFLCRNHHSSERGSVNGGGWESCSLLRQVLFGGWVESEFLLSFQRKCNEQGEVGSPRGHWELGVFLTCVTEQVKQWRPLLGLRTSVWTHPVFCS